jgi:hypothetical protein
MSTQYLGPKYTPLPRGLWEIAQKEKKKNEKNSGAKPYWGSVLRRRPPHRWPLSDRIVAGNCSGLSPDATKAASRG